MVDNIYTVSDVNRIIKQMIENRAEFFNIQLRGEVSNFRKYASGHCYFTLKDKNSVIKAVMFRGRAAELKFLPKDGDQVLAIGRIGVYERDGIYQLYVDIMIASGAGDLMVAYEKLKQKLEQEGLFLPARKREIPTQPQKIGIITSQSGAAIHDIITVSKRRSPGVKLVFFPVKVQGEDAGGEIVKAINFMNEHKLADVLIVGRGGGSIEDLWAFNEENVVRAIAYSKIPVVTAIGHETDFTLADFAADRRAATPSQAAEIVVPDVREFLRHLEQLNQRNIHAVKAVIERNESKIIEFSNALVFKEPDRWLADKKIAVDNCLNRIFLSINSIKQEYEHKYALLVTKLDAASPLNIMSRGYSIARKADGTIIKTINAVNVGESIETVTTDGVILSAVTDVKRR
ncbi:MAG: exodeoxyribonuclease VII large subunit [Acholeplasmataceae bacterium]|nr:exodeoxyribonuclease VII large subunit [Acholeplasmataceae bacterium]